MHKKIFLFTIAACLFLPCVFGRPKTKDELLQQARIHLNRGEFSEAEKVYKKVIDSDASCAEAYSGLALVYSSQGKQQDALSNANKALSLKPGTPEFLANLGYVYIKMEKYEEAEKKLREAVEKNNKLYQGFLWLAELSKRQEKYDLGLDYAKRASELNPDSYRPYEISAEIYVARKDYSNAVSYYIRAQLKNDTNFNLYLKCGEAALQQGNKRTAKKQFHKALRIRELDFNLRMRLAKMHMDDGEYDDAAEQFVIVVKKGPVELKGEAAYGAGLSLFKDENYKEAELYSKQAVDADPQNKKYRDLLSDVYEKQGKYEEAAEIAADPGEAADPNEYITLGRKHEKAGQLEQAQFYYEKGIGSDPGNGFFYLKLGVIRTKIEEEKSNEQDRDYTAAKEAYHKAFTNKLDDAPEIPKIAYNLAKLYELESDYTNALHYDIKAVKSNPFMLKAYIATCITYFGTKPWNNWVHVAVWSGSIVFLFSLYMYRRHKIKKKLAAQAASSQERKTK
jgi:tetratricopeptide (TPR) repeat protein